MNESGLPTNPGPPSTTPDVASASADGVWLSVSDELLWGFNHALGNRLAAITSIARILEYDGTGSHPLLPTLTEEIQKLERTLHLLRLVPRSGPRSPEPIRLEDLLPSVIALSEMRSDARDISYDLLFEEDVLPVWAASAGLTHVLLLVLWAASSEALASGSNLVALRVSSDERRTRVRVGSTSSGGREVAPIARNREVEVAGEMIGMLGGALLAETSDEGRGWGVTLELPTLLEARHLRARGGS